MIFTITKKLKDKVELQNKIIKYQMYVIINMGKELKKMREFREKRYEMRRMPHDEYVKWIYEQAKGL